MCENREKFYKCAKMTKVICKKDYGELFLTTF